MELVKLTGIFGLGPFSNGVWVEVQTAAFCVAKWFLALCDQMLNPTWMVWQLKKEVGLNHTVLVYTVLHVVAERGGWIEMNSPQTT